MSRYKSLNDDVVVPIRYPKFNRFGWVNECVGVSDHFRKSYSHQDTTSSTRQAFNPNVFVGHGVVTTVMGGFGVVFDPSSVAAAARVSFISFIAETTSASFLAI